MKKSHRKILSDLQIMCNQMGSTLDYTSTNESKLRDRQQSLMKISHILFGILVDHPENENNDYDQQLLKESMEHMRMLAKKEYPDRQGNF